MVAATASEEPNLADADFSRKLDSALLATVFDAFADYEVWEPRHRGNQEQVFGARINLV